MIKQRNSKGQVQFRDLTGQRFGRLIVEKFDSWYIYYNGQRKSARWKCVCQCGKEIVTSSSSLIRGMSQSCGCLRRELLQELLRKKAGQRSLNTIFRDYKYNANKRQIDFNLGQSSFNDLISKNCYYCASPPSNIKTTPAKGMSKQWIEDCKIHYNGIDRLNNTIGYTTSNVVPCCKICNYSKKNLSLSDFELWIKNVYNNFIKK